jgi:phage repressor protein C with HTH and peptisase S24 domain
LEKALDRTSLIEPAKTKSFEAKINRIMEAVGANSDTELGKALGITPQSVTAARRREKIPPSWYEYLFEELNVSVDWILNGTGSFKEEGQANVNNSCKNTQANSVVSCADNTVIDIDNYCFIPMVECRLSGGNGEPVYSEGIKDYYAFRKRFINYIATSAKNLVLMRVTGTSMEPEIQNGGTVMIDMGRKYPKGGAYFALGFGDTIMVKQLELLPANRVLIISKNRAEYQPYEANLSDIRIIGQVVWGDRLFPI